MRGVVSNSSSSKDYDAGWPDLSHAVRQHSETLDRLNDVIASLCAKRDRIMAAIAELRKDVFEVAAAAETNGHAKKRGRPKKVVEADQQQPKVRRLGIAGDVVSYLSGKEDGVAVEVIAESINCTKQQVSQVLTAGKKKGRFKVVSRGVWALA